MKTQVKRVVYNGRDNLTTFKLSINGQVFGSAAIDAITQVDIKYKNTIYSSASDFTLSKNNADGTITLTGLGLMDVPAGTDPKTELIIYDSANENGIYCDTFSLTFTDMAKA